MYNVSPRQAGKMVSIRIFRNFYTGVSRIC